MPKERILIIDKSPETRAMYAEYFRYHGYRVVEAADGAEGVRLFAQLQPDLVVTELSDEPEWARAIRLLRWPKTGGVTAVIACSTWIDRNRPAAPAGIDASGAGTAGPGRRQCPRGSDGLIGRRWSPTEGQAKQFLFHQRTGRAVSRALPEQGPISTGRRTA
jgi:CheY-like chemotaxis protein